MKNYSIRLRYGSLIKDMYFLCEEDSDKADKMWDEVCMDIERIGDSSCDENDFFNKVIDKFATKGFINYKK